MRELILREVDKKSEALEKEKGVPGSQGGEKDTLFFPALLPLSHIRCFFLNSELL